MKKKELIAQIDKILKINHELFSDNKLLVERLKDSEAVNINLKEEISSLNSEIEKLKVQLDNANNVIPEENFITAVEEENDIVFDLESSAISDNIISEIKLSDGTNFEKATEAIGKVVLKCADICEEFAKLDNINSKDLVNLALGRTEVFKSEVLNILNESNNSDNIDIVLNEKMQAVFDYFNLLYGQIN